MEPPATRKTTSTTPLPISVWGGSPALVTATATTGRHHNYHSCLFAASTADPLLQQQQQQQQASPPAPPPALLGLIIEIPIHAGLPAQVDFDDSNSCHFEEDGGCCCGGDRPVPSEINYEHPPGAGASSCSVTSNDLFSIASAPKHTMASLQTCTTKTPAAATRTTTTTTGTPQQAPVSVIDVIDVSAVPHAREETKKDDDEQTTGTVSSHGTDHTASPPRKILLTTQIPKQGQEQIHPTQTETLKSILAIPFSPLSPPLHQRHKSSSSSVASLPFVSVASHMTLLTGRTRRHSIGCMFSCFQPPEEKEQGEEKAAESTATGSSEHASLQHHSETSSTAAAVAYYHYSGGSYQGIGNSSSCYNVSLATDTDQEYPSCCAVAAHNTGDAQEEDSVSGTAAATIATTEDYDWENLQQEQQEGTGVLGLSIFDKNQENYHDFWNKYRRRMCLLKQLRRFVASHNGQPCRYTIRIMDEEHDHDERMPMEFRIYRTAGKRRLPLEPYRVLYGSVGIMEWIEPWVDFFDWFSARPKPLFDVWFNKLDIHMDDVDVNDARQIIQRQFYVSI